MRVNHTTLIPNTNEILIFGLRNNYKQGAHYLIYRSENIKDQVDVSLAIFNNPGLLEVIRGFTKSRNLPEPNYFIDLNNPNSIQEIIKATKNLFCEKYKCENYE
ncbi:hypothetical protein KAR91_20065 [Candidatus Pacearchaeota archaeon]|nr:hypothetical protein [Candidatus Pacearchaeota archaeon]